MLDINNSFGTFVNRYQYRWDCILLDSEGYIHAYASKNQGLKIEIKSHSTTKQLESKLKLGLKILTLILMLITIVC